MCSANGGDEQRPTLVLGHAAPDTEWLAGVQRVVQTGPLHRTAQTDGLGLRFAPCPFISRFMVHWRIKGPRLLPALAGGSTKPRPVLGVARNEKHSFHDFPHRVVSPISENRSFVTCRATLRSVEI